MKQIRYLAVILMVLAATMGAGFRHRPPPPPTTNLKCPVAVAWQTSEQYGTYTFDGYTWNNDAWSPGRGPQVICVNSPDEWYVVSSQVWNTQYWVETYPHIGWAGGKHLSQYVPDITASETETGPGHGDPLRWEAAYDIWLNASSPGVDNGYEIMIWTDTSGVSPCCSILARPVIDGVTYDFYQAPGGNGPGSWFVREGNSQSTTTDISAFIRWVKAYGGNYNAGSDPVVSTAEFGWEVWGTGGVPAQFEMYHYALTP